MTDVPVVAERYVCPRCNGRGGDPKLRPRQSCLICWGEGSIGAWVPDWDSQHGMALRELLMHHGTAIVPEEEA